MRINNKFLYMAAGIMAILQCLIPAKAFTQKIGYVASSAIFDHLQDSKSAKTKLSDLQAGWMREIERQEKDIQQLRDEIENNRLIWSAQEKRDGEARMADMQSKLVEFRTTKYGPKGEFEKQQADLMAPIFDKVMKAINEEARAQKIDLVFDKSSRGLSLLYSNPQYDLTISVLKRLGVELDSLELAPNALLESGGKSEDNSVRNGQQQGNQPTIEIDPNKLLEGKEGIKGNFPLPVGESSTPDSNSDDEKSPK